MLHHHTADPAVRAAHIADREADKMREKSGGEIGFNEAWLKVYSQILRELAGVVTD